MGLGNGDFFPHEHELDSLLSVKAKAVEKELKTLDTLEDPTKPKAALATAKTEVHESTSTRAARYFATHGMTKVSKMLGQQMSASATASLLKEQKQLAAKNDDLEMPDDDDDNSAYKAQWRKVDAIKRRETLRR